jgi:hypothetical protein
LIFAWHDADAARYDLGYAIDMKTAISLPDPVFRSAERLAARMGVSRSELYCRALRELLDRHDPAAITARLDAVYGEGGQDAGLEPRLADLQAQAVRGGPGGSTRRSLRRSSVA